MNSSGRGAVSTAQWPTLPAHAQRGTRPVLVFRLGWVGRLDGRVVGGHEVVLGVVQAGEGQDRDAVDLRALRVLLRRAERVQLGVAPDVLRRRRPPRHEVGVLLQPPSLERLACELRPPAVDLHDADEVAVPCARCGLTSPGAADNRHEGSPRPLGNERSGLSVSEECGP